MKTNIYVLLLVLISISASTQAQDSLMTAFGNFSNQLYAHPVNYINGYNLIEENKEVFEASSIEQFYYQTSSTFSARAGEHEATKEMYWYSKGLDFENTIINDDSFTDYNSIFENTSSRQVVMVNESHSYPEHRVFTTSLLQELFNQGFRYFALEDLGDHDKTINDRKHNLRTDGFHINETMFAEMVRKAKEIGFILVPYDNNDAWEIAERDSLGALELKRIFDLEPDAKMLVFCGLAHIDKTKKRLGYYIKSMLNIDPLTISQVTNVPVASSIISEPKIVTENSSLEHFPIPADYQIIHPVYNYNDRPEYLFQNYRIKKQIDLTDYNFDEPLVLEVYPKGYEDNSIPFDRLIINPEDQIVNISALPGELELIFSDIDSVIVKRLELSVK